MNSITIQSPATVANLCCGFDILGMALKEPFDTITLQKSETAGIRIRHTDEFGLPESPKENIAGVALQAMIDALGYNNGFDIEIHKGIKPGSGIGSSAASAAGIVVAANKLLGNPFNNKELTSFAMEGEVLASGARHADNIAPCIYGGVTLIRDTASLDIISLRIPELYVTVVHPQIEIKTSYAREILPNEVPLKTAVKQWANVAGLIAALEKSDYELLARSLEDFIVEPVRSRLIPGFSEVKRKSLLAGALGGGISGSGPSVFMLSPSQDIATAVGQEMAAVFNPLHIEHKIYVTGIGRGAG